MSFSLTPSDLEQLSRHGLDPASVEAQLQRLANPPAPWELLRPCRPGDGVLRLSEEERPRLLELWREAARAGRFLKFVPASGAATRMFRALSWYRAEHAGARRSQLATLARQGEATARELLALLDRLDELPFAGALAAALESRGLRLEGLVAGERYGELFDCILAREGLGLAATPKALLPFHRYPWGARTSFEEHLVEGAGHLTADGGLCRLHFTVLPAHRQRLRDAFDRIRGGLERRLGVRFELELSTQDSATDTVALGPDGRPARAGGGELLLRPGGHGSLLANLARLDADLVFIKNVDNIAPERLHRVTVPWKRLLAGLLVDLQQRLFELADEVERGAGVERALELLGARFAARPPARLAGDAAGRRRWARDHLSRPLRVCGVVPAAGHAGGAPYWVRGDDGGAYGQIVENAQIDRSRPDQLEVVRRATHFNPVDLVCALRDRHGRPYDLAGHVDPDAAFITTKTYGHLTLRALEHPGLWNGAMAKWNTAFVEVPPETFNPVKSVTDLLRPAHQPWAAGEAADRDDPGRV